MNVSDVEIPPNISAANFCLQISECVAYTESNEGKMLIKSLNIDSFTLRSNSTTYLKLENVSEKTKIFGFDVFDKFDQCCTEPTEFDLRDLFNGINDTVERVPCDIPREMFLTTSASSLFLNSARSLSRASSNSPRILASSAKSSSSSCSSWAQ